MSIHPRILSGRNHSEGELRRKNKDKNYATPQEEKDQYLFSKILETNYLIENVDKDFVHAYYLFLLNTGACNHNSVLKHLRNLKQMTNKAFRKRLIPIDPFEDYELTDEEVIVYFLDETEILLLLNEEFTVKRLE